MDAFIAIYGVSVAEKMINLQEYDGLGVKIQGIISSPECNKYLNHKYIKSMQEPRFKEWIKIYKI